MFRHIADFVLGVLCHILFKLDIIGIQNVPTQGPFIAMMNHIYFIDPVLVATLAPRNIVIMSKIENYQNPLLALVMRLYGTFPVHRGELDMTAIRTSLRIMQEGHGLLMAPEGTRSKSRTLQEGRDGMAWLALRSQAPIVPVALSGQEYLGHNLRRLRRTPLRVVFGEPFYFRSVLHPASSAGSAPDLQQPFAALKTSSDAAPRTARGQLRRMTQEAMYALAKLLPPAYRGMYSDLEKATADTMIPYGSGQGSSR
jgi:1-acyl-sn-glycerol-3-phosphate acyltransferase